jgi:hypothetical protein
MRARVEATRRRRQALLARGWSVRIFLLLDESVLRRPIGGRAIFTAQLKELERLTTLGLRIRMIPLSMDVPVTNNGSFDLVSLGGEHDGGTVLYRENGMADDLIENSDSTERHLARFDMVWRDEADTMAFIRQRISRLRRSAA